MLGLRQWHRYHGLSKFPQYAILQLHQKFMKDNLFNLLDLCGVKHFQHNQISLH